MTTHPAPYPHTRTAAEQLIVDTAEMWLDRYDRATHLPRHEWLDLTDPLDRLWTATAGAIYDGWAALYLLSLLRTHAPHAAEHAAKVLAAPDMPFDLPTQVRQWADTAGGGGDLNGLLP